MQEFRLPGSSICKVSRGMQDVFQNVHTRVSSGLIYWLLMLQEGSPLSPPFSLPFLCLLDSLIYFQGLTYKLWDVTFQTVLNQGCSYPSVCWSPPQGESPNPANSIQLKLMTPALPLKTYPPHAVHCPCLYNCTAIHTDETISSLAIKPYRAFWSLMYPV